MKITIGHLRRIIQEVLSEAPLADDGITPLVNFLGKSPEEEDIATRAGRFHKSGLYKKQAENTFKEYPQHVYIIPAAVPGVTNSLIPGSARAAVLDPVSTFELLKQKGWEYDNPDHLLSELENGATVFINLAAKLKRGFLPTTWMLHHAIFDCVYKPIFLEKEYHDIFKLIFDTHNLDEGKLRRRLTMKSAREGTLTPGSDNDIIAEIMTQAIVTTDGVQFTWRTPAPGEPAYDKTVENMKKKISDYIKSKSVDQISDKVGMAWKTWFMSETEELKLVTSKKKISASELDIAAAAMVEHMPDPLVEKMADIKAKIDAMNLKTKFHEAVKGKLIAVSNATGADLDINSGASQS